MPLSLTFAYHSPSALALAYHSPSSLTHYPYSLSIHSSQLSITLIFTLTFTTFPSLSLPRPHWPPHLSPSPSFAPHPNHRPHRSQVDRSPEEHHHHHSPHRRPSLLTPILTLTPRCSPRRHPQPSPALTTHPSLLTLNLLTRQTRDGVAQQNDGGDEPVRVRAMEL